MKHKLIVLLTILISVSSAVEAGTIDIGGSGNNEFVQSVVGTWANSQTISFSESGTYTMSLTDFSFGQSFETLGVMISTSVHTVARIIISADDIKNQSLTFNINEGRDYWLSVFALTGDKKVGAFGVNVVDGTLAPVPLPPAIVFFGTALLGFGSFIRQRKSTRNV